MNLLCALLLFVQSDAPPPSQAPTTDRSAFTFTEYRLQATLDPAKHAISVEGDLVVRNDSDRPQSVVPLQLSSSLQWLAITQGGSPAQYRAQRRDSDIDHTGAVSEAQAAVAPVAPQAAITLHVRYAGTIELGSERLARLGTPRAVAEQSDWDRIGADITALRGVGYVQWYPASMPLVSLREGNAVFTAVADWKARHQDSRMTLRVEGARSVLVSSADEEVPTAPQTLQWQRFGMQTPVLVAAGYETTKMRGGALFSLPGSGEDARRYADAFDAALTAKVFAGLRPVYLQKIVQLPKSFTPFESKGVLLTPFADTTPSALRLTLAHTGAHTFLRSNRAWLDEGFAHWAQLVAVKDGSGREAALKLLRQREAALALADTGDPTTAQSLTVARDELFYRTKAMFVWWMLSDLIGEDKLLAAVRVYAPAKDNEPAYFQRIVETEAKKDLEQFFDDWVYRDKGLPDFKVTDVYARQNLNGGVLVTVTVENTGGAGAEVPVTVRGKNVENSARLWVPAKGKASARIVLPLPPVEAAVNDGSVPEIDPTDNSYTVPSPR